MYSGQLIIDADHGKNGWEVSIRADAESMEFAWSGVSDNNLSSIIGFASAEFFISERDNHRK